MGRRGKDQVSRKNKCLPDPELWEKFVTSIVTQEECSYTINDVSKDTEVMFLSVLRKEQIYNF